MLEYSHFFLKYQLRRRDNSDIVSDTTNQADLFPVEFLNSLNIAGMPPHKLRLKIGISAILLRNLNPALGLCNGTRLQVQQINQWLLTVKILNGSNEGDITHIPCIDLIESSGDLPFRLKRRQFSIKVAFAMTINKAQGQSLKQVGIYLPCPVFDHGQLYITLSRSGNL